MERNSQGSFLRVVMAAFLVASLGMLSSCGGGGGGGGAVGTAAPSAFKLNSPGDDSTVSLTPTLCWNSSSGAATYTIQVTTDSSFATITTFQSTTVPSGTTSILISGGTLTHDKTYYWRVLAVNSGGSTVASSAPYLFTTNKGTANSGDVVWSITNDPSSIDDQSFGMVISGTDMYVIGYDSNTTMGDDQWHMEKRTLDDGSLVAAFGTTNPGVVVSNPFNATLFSLDDANAVAADTTALYVVGFDSVAGDDDWGWRIEKRDLVTGASITAFGAAGAVSENINTGVLLDDAAVAVAVDSSPTGTMYIVGYVSPALMGTEWRIEARNKVTGSLVSSVTSSFSAGDDSANAIAIDPTEGYMYVVGSDSSLGDTQWRIEKRTLSAPMSLETASFGGSLGYVVSNPSTTYVDKPFAIALDTLYLYVAGFDNAGTLPRWRIEKRDRSDGTLVISFGTGGSVNSNTTTGAVANAIAVDSNYIYVAGYDNTASGALEWRIEKRDITTGALVTTFGSNGVVVNNFGLPALDHDIWTIAVDTNHVYVAGYESVDATNSRWRIMKLLK